jgi:hypothetical protein
MGINLHAFNFIKKISKEIEFKNTLTIGRLKITADKYAVNKIVNDETIKSKYIDEYLIKHFRSSNVDVLDFNDYEDANIIHNLNEVIPKNLENKYDTIIDGGSLEHIFDVKTSFNNLKKMCKVNGVIIHISPTNNHCGHGFYQFCPNFFYSFYNERKGFKDTQIFLCKEFDSSIWYKIKKENYKNNKRINIVTDEETVILCSSIKVNSDNSEIIQQSDYSDDFYNKRKREMDNITNKVIFQKEISLLRIALFKIAKIFPILKFFYNYVRKLKEHKNSKLNKFNKNLEIINVNKL